MGLRSARGKTGVRLASQGDWTFAPAEALITSTAQVHAGRPSRPSGFCRLAAAPAWSDPAGYVSLCIFWSLQAMSATTKRQAMRQVREG